MRLRGRNEYARVAAPWPCTALSADSTSTSSSVGVWRPALQLPRANLPSGHGDREAVENGSAAAATDPTAGPSSTRPSCTPPQPPPAASPAAASVPATIGRLCAILAHLARHLAHAIGLWREQSTALSAAPERGFKNATQACKEGPMGMGLVRDPSSWLARAMSGTLTHAWRRVA